MSELEFRRPTPDEVGAFISVSVRSYGSDDSPDAIAHEVLSNESERSFGALDDGRWVGGGGAFSLEMTLPGGTVLPTAGVTMIGVEPTHRRRGILTRLIGQLHHDAIERDEPLAALTASETSIYRRFGYGMVADVAHLSIAANRVVFDPPVDDAGCFEPFDPHVATTELAEIHDRARQLRTGWLRLTDGMWEQISADPPHVRNGRTPLRGVIHHDADGHADGYALWRIGEHTGSDRIAANTLYIEHLVGLTNDVEAALWAFVASIDLVTRVDWIQGQPEPTIRWRLVEPRQLRTLARTDMVWVRILDVPAVLTGRALGTSGSLIVDVLDRFHPEVGGRFEVSCAGRGEIGRCKRLGASSGADESAISVDVADLAPIIFGSVAPSAIASTGHLTGTAAAIDLADAMFVTATRPWWPIEF